MKNELKKELLGKFNQEVNEEQSPYEGRIFIEGVYGRVLGDLSAHWILRLYMDSDCMNERYIGAIPWGDETPYPQNSIIRDFTNHKYIGNNKIDILRAISILVNETLEIELLKEERNNEK